jgi:Zn ribbon nucleic-acid-binding protein
MNVVENTQCPYCKENTTIELPSDYAPVYVTCMTCGKKIIAERRAIGFKVYTTADVPYDSDPDSREIEAYASDEQ